MARRSSSGRAARLARRLLLGVLLLAALILLSLAFPVRVWRTGERPAAPLPLVPGGPVVEPARRVWIDTDAACGVGRTTDPDDCFALLLLARAPGLSIAGISTVHGNAPGPVTDSVTRLLAARLRPDDPPPVHRGSAKPLDETRQPAAAGEALRRALEEGPLTIVALGPLTNVAAALQRAGELRRNVVRVVAVMGRRPGHLFHPAEGAGGGMLFGHGPVFTDFNFAQDQRAAAWLVGSGLPITLVPYEAARQVTLRGPDLDAVERASPAGAWVVARSRAWLDYWKDDVGRDGFYPFDLVGAAYALAPELFDCADVRARVARDERLWGWLGAPPALMVGPDSSLQAESRAEGTARYCPGLRPALYHRLMEGLTSAGAAAGGSDPQPVPEVGHDDQLSA
ncbi:MAG TPA: nucleoside hydrolase [Gemmatimonadales bacterium]|nr:nucleoside hydrolase [Gemmatimonadales bacterium]